MAGYSQTPLWKKLGYKDRLRVYVQGAPPRYKAALDLPDEVQVEWKNRLTKDTSFVHLFATSRRALSARLRELRHILPDDAIIWVSWPKKSSGVSTDLTENAIREIAFPLGFVDIKVCAVDEIWSALKIVRRRELRGARD
jgi:hypothetical protein